MEGMWFHFAWIEMPPVYIEGKKRLWKKNWILCSPLEKNECQFRDMVDLRHWFKRGKIDSMQSKRTDL